MRRAVLGLAVLVVLSGCTTPFDADSGGDGVETVTPASVPSGFDGPPGVDHQRDVLDPVALVAAHERALDNGSAAVRFEARRWQVANRSYGFQSRGEPISSEERLATETVVRTGEPTVFSRYTNDSVGYTYGTWSNGTHTVEFADVPEGIARTVSPSSSRPDEPLDLARTSTLGVWFNNSQVQAIDRTETAKGVRYRVRATSDDRGLLGSSAERTHNGVTNGTLVATIRPDGLVTDLRLEFTLLTRAGNFRTAYRYSVTTDVETLPRPSWVERTLARGNTSLDS
ncbi:hypothetical protein [Halapricum salinum]|uniref:Lipoprotein n=1 Tax=Halapricum salinum TaxID=1457250 RepID=A0A4D6HBL1_9EURY|nr:hypothetical protein [Halapricum salinum]QCC50901.1 hypothetical protein DV733_06425 [Halapricum salinum]